MDIWNADLCKSRMFHYILFPQCTYQLLSAFQTFLIFHLLTPSSIYKNVHSIDAISCDRLISTRRQN